jgi:uncharacterized protein (DUF58 family)
MTSTSQPMPNVAWSSIRSRLSLGALIRRALNHKMPPSTSIRLRTTWPLWVVPWALINQILAPHPVWVVLLVSMIGLYGLGLLWVRSQGPAIGFDRKRIGSILVAGDKLVEEFELKNSGRLPLLWAEFVDGSTVPGYGAGRVVACAGESTYRWRTDVECSRRGVYQLGPHLVRTGDPFGLYDVEVRFDQRELVVIYPRVADLPSILLPRGSSTGVDRRRRAQYGPVPSSSVSDYRPGDSLRRIHWPTTAHRGKLMVKELELEPSGDVWIVLDLNREAQSGEGDSDTLEYAIVLAASLANALLSGADRRAVGLMCVSGDQALRSRIDGEASDGGITSIVLTPQTGAAQLWQILTALAPVRAANVSLAEVLRSAREPISARSTLIIITPDFYQGRSATTLLATESRNGNKKADELGWVPELLHLKARGTESSVVLVAPGEADSDVTTDGAGDGAERQRAIEKAESIQHVLAQADIPAEVIAAGSPLRAVATFRRRRMVVRTTPTGGTVTYELEEDVS